MKLSKFNHVTVVDGEEYIFNAYRRGLHKIDRVVSRALKRLDAEDVSWSDDLPEDFYQSLLANGYIVEDDVDEHAEILAERENIKADRTKISITIAPTIDCNFGCPYCFEGENKPKLRMNERTMRSTINFIKALVTPETKSLHICWFGGEPLLGLPQMEKLTDMLREDIVLPHNLKYVASIVTNGYGLTRKVALRLRAIGVESAQVTLDGTQEHHDARRFRLGGHPTFEQIVKNLKESCDLITITVRVNVDRENRDSFVPLVRQLNEVYGMKGKMFIYPAIMRDDGDASWDKVYSSNRGFMKDKLELHQQAIAYGTRVLNYPKAVRIFCGVPVSTFLGCCT